MFDQINMGSWTDREYSHEIFRWKNKSAILKLCSPSKENICMRILQGDIFSTKQLHFSLSSIRLSYQSPKINLLYLWKTERSENNEPKDWNYHWLIKFGNFAENSDWKIIVLFFWVWLDQKRRFSNRFVSLW